jgi:hypothetical protein
MASPPPRFVPRIERFITAQEVRNIRAQLRRMSEPQGMDGQKVSEEHRRRVNPEHPGVTGITPRRFFLTLKRHPHSD